MLTLQLFEQTEARLQKSEEIERLRRFIQQQQRDLGKANEELAETKRRIAQLEIENDGLRRQPPVLPHDPVLPNHEFGPKMVSVCVNLAMKVGLRASITCLKIMMDWLASESSTIDCPPVHPDIANEQQAGLAQKIQSRLCSRVCETDENLGQ